MYLRDGELFVHNSRDSIVAFSGPAGQEHTFEDTNGAELILTEAGEVLIIDRNGIVTRTLRFVPNGGIDGSCRGCGLGAPLP